jgi:MATE family multidrug resistance protein
MSSAADMRREGARLLRLAVPVAASNLLMIGMGAVDQLLIGRYGTTEFAAVGLANPWIFGTVMFANGILLGLDPIIAQAHGAGDGLRSARALHTGLVLAGLLSLPVALAWWFTEPVLVAFGQSPELAQQSAVFVRAQMPSIPFFLGNTVLSRYLQNREHVKQTVVVMSVANVVNALAAWSLIYGRLGAPELGVLGAGLATTCARIAAALTLIGWTRVSGCTTALGSRSARARSTRAVCSRCCGWACRSRSRPAPRCGRSAWRRSSRGRSARCSSPRTRSRCNTRRSRS